MKGFGKVFSFTTRQTFKNKAYLASFIIFVVVMAIMGPLQYAMQSVGESTASSVTTFDAEDTAVEKLYILNETPFEITADGIEGLYVEDGEEGFSKDQVSVIGRGEMTVDELTAKLGKTDCAVVISQVSPGENENPMVGYEIKGIIADDTDVTVSEIDQITGVLQGTFDEKRLEEANLSDEDIQMIYSGIDTNGVTEEDDFLAREDTQVDRHSYMSYVLGFSVIIFIMISMSTTYIITSVTEEKQSKLVETLLVSVRPMALLMGKVCGMISYVVLVLVCGFIGSKISNAIMVYGLGVDSSKFNNSGFNFSIFSDFGIVGAIVLLLSVVLAFLLFGVFSGLMGSACIKPEDVQSATGSVMTISMIGYFASIVISASDNSLFNTIGCIVPPFSFFLAPVAFITGRLNAGLLILSFALMVVALVLVMLLSAKTYRNLLLSDSSTPKLKAIFKSAKG